jgi:hypothetical protein
MTQTPNKQKRFNIGTVKLSMEANGFPKGFILNREPTERETMYILSNLLGFAVDDYKDWFDDKEERQDFRKDCQVALTKYLKGECDYSHLCNETQCYDDDEIGFPMVYAFSVASYLQKKGII